MLAFQIGFILTVLLFLVIEIILLLRKFEKGSTAIYFIVPSTFFAVGFSLRLTSNKSMIDLGYFLTEISLLFTYILLVIFLFLGQAKYWKK